MPALVTFSLDTKFCFFSLQGLWASQFLMICFAFWFDGDGQANMFRQNNFLSEEYLPFISMLYLYFHLCLHSAFNAHVMTADAQECF